MRIDGKCHCGNIRFDLEWPGPVADMKVRACGCTFCTKHGGAWTSHRDATLSAVIESASLVSKYSFGTGTAEFYVCSRCGVVPFVTSQIDEKTYAVVNVNTFEGVERASLERTQTDFEREGIADRLKRRQRNWIATVNIAEAPGVSQWTSYPVAVVAAEAPARMRPSNYPEPFASRVAGRLKRPLGDQFGLTNFGVNLTTLAPGAISALRHAHTKQDEFVFIVTGQPTLVTDEGRTQLAPGMCAAFKAGTGDGHHLVNDSDADVVYLEVGDRTPGDQATYPDDDLMASMVDGKWQFTHKDGSRY